MKSAGNPEGQKAQEMKPWGSLGAHRGNPGLMGDWTETFIITL